MLKIVQIGCSSFVVWVLLALSGCAGGTPSPSEAEVLQIHLPIPAAWGGDVRCSTAGCRLAAVEHERGTLVVHQINQRTTKPVSRVEVAYHPDTAKWLSDNLIVAAVEGASGLDIYQASGDQLTRVAQVSVGFQPRDVILLSSKMGYYSLLATPYSGDQVAWVTWSPHAPNSANVVNQVLCKAPWHPQLVHNLASREVEGVLVGCLDDQKVVFVKVPGAALQTPDVIQQFTAVPRNVAVSPNGEWWYVSLELGGRNARISTKTHELQWLQATTWGSIAVASVDDETVAWGEDLRVVLQRYDATGKVLASKVLPTTGFSSSLQVVDADADGNLDVVVYNSSGEQVDILFGPLWDNATVLPSEPGK